MAYREALASVGVMTTGTDIPNIDCISLLFATKSPGKLQQVAGRGFRVVYAPGYDIGARQGRVDAIRNGPKPNFLILDHGGNLDRHGPIHQITKPAKKDKSKKTPLPKSKIRICEVCRTAWPLEVTMCGICGNQLVVERDPTSSLSIEASSAEIMGSPFTRGEVAQWFDIDDVRYHRHKKEGAPNTLRVTYYSGILQFNEFIHFERIGSLRAQAIKWWSDRSSKPAPSDAAQALKWASSLKSPARVMVHKKKDYYQVVRYEFERKADVITPRKETFDLAN